LTVDERIDYLERRLAKYWREALQVTECEPRGKLFRTIMLLERERKRRTALTAKSGTAGSPRADRALAGG
jgi:hypothetical protein